ncbi:MAG TPA: cytochrome P450 [Mycobacteriales bacterium]|jgi:cytochrome P450|nr:cytochrome P450 [Mycobacteriales bacterium]
MSLAEGARWALMHGSARALMRRARRKGDLVPALMLEGGSDDPYPIYDEVRRRGKVVPGTFAWATGHHDVVTEVLRDNRFSVRFDGDDTPWYIRAAIAVSHEKGLFNPVEPPSMLAVDPPQHTRYRKLVQKAFTARAVERLRDRVHEITEELLDDLARRPSVDLAADYAGILPVTVIAEMLGVPTSMRAQFLEWGNEAALTLDIGLPYRDYQRAMHGLRGLNGWFREHFEAVRRNPKDDIISALATLEDEGDRLNDDELMATALLLLGAGFETTVNLIGNGALALVQHPEQLEALQAEPELWPNAVEEVLRFDSPVQSTGRLATEDVELAGVHVPRRTIVVTLLGAANRDPAVFTEPDRFDVRRANAREHLAFSSGVHYCLGANLARLEGEVALRMLFDRFPDLSLAGQPHRRDTRTLWGYDAMPVALHGSSRPVQPVGA